MAVLYNEGNQAGSLSQAVRRAESAGAAIRPADSHARHVRPLIRQTVSAAIIVAQACGYP
ncbi:hypothetical protein [Duganella sp. BuS-21]|uniref:hypothetical protein n=1 Tax=Duganella sp. BuS-21 TaxID=2943848 RepID=UPI0035A612C7